MSSTPLWPDKYAGKTEAANRFPAFLKLGVMYLARWFPCIAWALCINFFPCYAMVAEPAGQVEITLEDAIGIARVHNLSLISDRIGLKISSNRETLALTEFDVTFAPRVIGEASSEDKSIGLGVELAKKFGLGTKITLSADGSRGDRDSDEDGAKYSSIWGVRLDQPLLGGWGRLIHEQDIVAAGYDIRRETRQVYHAEMELIIRVAETYLDLIRLENEARVNERFRERMTRLYHLTKAREKFGKSTKVDTLRVELRKNQAAAALENSREIKNIRYRDFLELLGADQGALITLTMPEVPDSLLPEVNEAMKIARYQRLDYAQAREDIEKAGWRVDVARREILPSVNLVLGYEQFAEGDDTSDLVDWDDGMWFLGISSETDIVRTAEKTRFQDARVIEAQVRLAEESVSRSLTAQVEQALANCRRAKTEYRLGKRSVKLGKSQALMAQKLFSIGRGDNLSVTNAEDDLLASELNLLTMKKQVVLSQLRLRKILGTLIETPDRLKSVYKPDM